MKPYRQAIRAVALAALVGLASAAADSARAGDFDYYVMALSWSPTWCDLTARARGAAQCAPDRDFGWILHGLWPQHERGWPSWCDTTAPAPSSAATAAMADIMGSAGLADYQWRKHGACSGLEPDAYFTLSRRAFGAVTRPPVFRSLDRDVALPARVVEEAWLEANPTLSPDAITVTCRDGHVQEVRMCLTRDLRVRSCGADVRRDCTLQDAILPAIE